MEVPAIVHEEAAISECVNVVHAIALCYVGNEENHKDNPQNRERLERPTPGQASE